MRGAYTSTPPVVLMAWCLVKHSDNLFNKFDVGVVTFQTR